MKITVLIRILYIICELKSLFDHLKKHKGTNLNTESILSCANAAVT